MSTFKNRLVLVRVWMIEFIKRVINVLPFHQRIQHALTARGNRARAKEMMFLSGVDIIHCYTGNLAGSAIEAVVEYFQIPGLAAWQGSEARIAEVELQDNPYFHFLLDDSGHTATAQTARSIQRQKRCAELGFEPAVTRDMLQYVLPEYRDQAHLLTHPIKIDHQPSYPDPQATRPLILHAPSKPYIKGTAYVERALNRLKDLGVEFEYLYLTGVPHEQVLEAMQRCDIFLDHFLLGNVCVAALEAMSYGKPTVFFLKESIQKLYPDELAFVNANPDNLASRLFWLIKDGQAREDIGRRARSYIETYHTPEKVAHELDEVYRDVLARKNKRGGPGSVISEADIESCLQVATECQLQQMKEAGANSR
ncbi:MAG: glycosyltransferase [Coriobacteriia bacterium]|nr:glycosyltransferase [Coriobacteriia bacterium]